MEFLTTEEVLELKIIKGDPWKPKRGYLMKRNLKHGSYYCGTCRNAQVARWNAEKEEFIYWRQEWYGDEYTETIKHPEDDNGMDLFYPFGEIASDFIPFEEYEEK